jgi:hypothetical protein
MTIRHWVTVHCFNRNELFCYVDVLLSFLLKEVYIHIYVLLILFTSFSLYIYMCVIDTSLVLFKNLTLMSPKQGWLLGQRASGIPARKQAAGHMWVGV